MKEWFGKIKIGSITNTQTVTEKTAADPDAFVPMDGSQVKFVHYPDCQQLIIWLPRPGTEYGNLTLLDLASAEIIAQWKVIDRLSGSIQLVLDTLPVAPGNYNIVIKWKNGWEHRIALDKQEAVVELPEPKPETGKIDEQPPSAPIVYRDGQGAVIEDVAAIMQKKLKEKILDRFSRTIQYEGNLRGGSVIYTDHAHLIRFNHEMGGGNCIFYIDIPGEERWETETKTSLQDRKEILEFVARTVKQDQAPSCRFEIGEDAITYYYR